MVDWTRLTSGLQSRLRTAFGTPAVYRIDGLGAGSSIEGIFRDAAIDVIVDLRADGAMVAPFLDVLEADLPAGALEREADTVELTDHGAKLYRVRDSEPDGEGIVRLILHEQP